MKETKVTVVCARQDCRTEAVRQAGISFSDVTAIHVFTPVATREVMTGQIAGKFIVTITHK